MILMMVITIPPTMRVTNVLDDVRIMATVNGGSVNVTQVLKDYMDNVILNIQNWILII